MLAYCHSFLLNRKYDNRLLKESIDFVLKCLEKGKELIIFRKISEIFTHEPFFFPYTANDTGQSRIVENYLEDNDVEIIESGVDIINDVAGGTNISDVNLSSNEPGAATSETGNIGNDSSGFIFKKFYSDTDECGDYKLQVDDQTQEGLVRVLLKFRCHRMKCFLFFTDERPPVECTGRRDIDALFYTEQMLKKLQEGFKEMGHGNGIKCEITDLKVVSQCTRGCEWSWLLRCSKCTFQTRLYSEPAAKGCKDKPTHPELHDQVGTNMAMVNWIHDAGNVESLPANMLQCTQEYPGVYPRKYPNIFVSVPEYTCKYIRVYTQVYSRKYPNILVSVPEYTCKYIRVYTQVYSRKYPNILVSVPEYTCKYIRVYTQVYSRKYPNILVSIPKGTCKYIREYTR